MKREKRCVDIIMLCSVIASLFQPDEKSSRHANRACPPKVFVEKSNADRERFNEENEAFLKR